MQVFKLTSQLSLELEEIEALTLQLMKTKQLLTEQRCLLAAREQASQEIDCQLAREIAMRQSLEQQVQLLHTQQLQKNEKIVLQAEQVVALENETLRLQEALQKTRKASDTRDEELKTAQQHLAKKVRENARQQEQLETITAQMQAFEDEARQKRLQVESFKNELSRWQRREVQLQEQLRDQAIASEAKLNQLQAEFADIQERWKLAEMQLQKLRILEGQHQQMRALLGESTPKLSTERESMELPPISEPMDVPPAEIHVAPPVRMRQNFFD